MMIPPLIRTGPVPAPQQGVASQDLVVLTNRGWAIVRWSSYGMLNDTNPYSRQHVIDPLNVLCWMPADGS